MNLKELRQKEIVNLLEAEGSILVLDLSKRFNVSEMTIRRDLFDLERQGMIERTHGGAILGRIPANSVEKPILERMSVSQAEKKAIAKATADLIQPNEMVLLGSGTTTTYLAKELANRKDIRIVTNALTVMNELAVNGASNFIGIGGFFRESEMSFYGHFSEKTLQELHVDKVIMGMRGIHPRLGLTSDHPQELATDRAMMAIGDIVIIMADHSKIGYTASGRAAPINSADFIVTSKLANWSIVEEIRNLGVNVILV